MKKLFLVVLCFCLCISLPACKAQKNRLGAYDDAFQEGVAYAREDFFMDLWNASYNRSPANRNTLNCGELWKTDDFSLLITAKRGLSPLLENSEAFPYLEVKLKLNHPSIEECWENGNLIFDIYSASEEGTSTVWVSDYYFDYFSLVGELNDNKGYTEVEIDEGTQILRVLIVTDGCIYTARYFVDI